jgi:hypothetical protein
LKALVTGAGSPTGNVAFLDGTTSIGNGSLNAGTAVLTTTNLQLGTHVLTASFAANPSGGASSSVVVNEVIVADPRAYTLSSNSPLTLQTEHHGSTTVTATPLSGLSDTVSISCGSLPIYASCEVVPTQVSIGNGTSQNVTVKIDTDQVLGYASRDRHRLGILAFLVPCLFLGLSFRQRNIKLRGILLGILAFLASGTVGCSGKYPMATPPGTYSIVINGHGQASGLDRTTTLTLIVTAK